MTVKYCNSCGVNPKEFGPGKRYCSECREIIPRQNKPSSKKTREWGLKARYGLTESQLIILLEQQDYKCAICLKEITLQTLRIDHDHNCCDNRLKTCGKCLRGLLCNGCNTSLGQFKDSIVMLERAIDYLRNPPIVY